MTKLKVGDYIVAAKGCIYSYNFQPCTITKSNKYQIIDFTQKYARQEGLCELLLVILDDCGNRHAFDLSLLEEDSSCYTFDTLNKQRERKIKSIL